MAAAACTDQEFMRLYDDFLSPQRMADHLGVSTSSIRHRRKRLEKCYPWVATIKDAGRNITINNKMVSDAARAILSWKVDNGTVIVGSDAHLWPEERTTSQRAFLYFAEFFDPAPVGIIINGDMFDGARISRFPAASFLEHGRPTVKQEIDEVSKFLGDLEKRRRGAELIWPLGNHDLRYEARLAQQVPEYEGIANFHLKDHFPLWRPCWRLDINDDVVVKHRWHNGLHATHNNALKGGKTVVTGHLHSLKVTPWTDFNGTRYGVDTGTLGDIDGQQTIHYTEAGAVNWRSGFIVLTFRDGQLLYPETVQKWDEDHVQFRGQLIRV